MSQRTAVALLAALCLFGPTAPFRLTAQQAQSDDFLRRAKVKVAPVYPELARKMSVSGTVKIEVVVAPNGTVKQARVVGGHPVLVNAALDAARKWRFEPASTDSVGIIDFKFGPQ